MGSSKNLFRPPGIDFLWLVGPAPLEREAGYGRRHVDGPLNVGRVPCSYSVLPKGIVGSAFINGINSCGETTI